MRVTLDFPAAEEILQEVGLDEQGDAQMFHTKNVLRRVQKYMPYRTGATIKLTVAQTDPRVPEIVTEEPQAVYLYNSVSRSGKPLNYMKQLLEALTALLKVKTIVTLVIIAVLAALSLNGSVEPDKFLTIATMVVAFYFGTQNEKKS